MPVDVGQPAVDAVVAERQPFVVDAQQVQDRGVQVVAVGLVLDRLVDRTRRSRRRRRRRLTPAPASQVTNVPPLWSRPVAPWVNGMRPNSVVQMTSVSSSRPACFQVVEQAGDWLVDLRAMGGSSLGMLVWLSQLFVRPARAAPDLHEAHAALEQPAGDQAVAAEIGSVACRPGRRACGSARFRADRSSTSGALSCICAASS